MEFFDNVAYRNKWLFFIGLVLCAKVIILMLDPLPMFFLGDSHSYITTSLTGWIPLDRSFTYGFLIRLLTSVNSSLTTLVIGQVLAGCIASISISFILINFLHINHRLSFMLGLLCALEPLQLLYERYVMTETFSLLVFAMYLIAIFYYLEKKYIYYLILLQILGTFLISLRLSYLPLVLVNSAILPLLAVTVFANNNTHNKMTMTKLFKSNFCSFRIIRIVSLHLILSLGSVFIFHSGYKQLNGFLSKKPSAYLYQSGIFLLANWSPIVKPVDFARPEIAPIIFNNLQFELQDRFKRSSQHWQPGGIIDALNTAIPNPLEADAVAKTTAISAFRRDPFALVMLTMMTFKDYFNSNRMLSSMENDSGVRPLPNELLDALRDNYNLSAENLPNVKTLTKKYYFICWPWYLFILFIPVIAALNLVLCNYEYKKYLLIIFIASLEIVAVSTALVEGPTIRYLHPLCWLAFLVFGALLNSVFHPNSGKSPLAPRN